MHELMEACQELSKTDVAETAVAETAVAPAPSALAPAPSAPAPSVAENAKPSSDGMGDSLPDEETHKSLQWASKLQDDANAISLFRSLPQAIINEQVELYRSRSTEPAVAAHPPDKLDLGIGFPSHQTKNVGCIAASHLL